MTELPNTPDFDHWPSEHIVSEIGFTDDVLSVIWSNDRTAVARQIRFLNKDQSHVRHTA